MHSASYIPIVIIIINILFTYRDLNNKNFFEEYLFEMDKILLFKEPKRLLTSGFLHND